MFGEGGDDVSESLETMGDGTGSVVYRELSSCS